MNSRLIAQSVGLFAVTNIDDVVVLALFFAKGAGHPSTTRRVAAGQYLGFTAILAAAVAAALGATFLPSSAIPYLGVLPLLLGLRAGRTAWHGRKGRAGAAEPVTDRPARPPGVLEVATVTFANGGDNIGVYVPVFATAGVSGMAVYVAVFLILLAGLVTAGRAFAARPAVAAALSRWGHVLLPVVLVSIGMWILARGGAFGR